MDKIEIINNAEKHLNICFKNIRISEIEKIEIVELLEKENSIIVKYSGDINIVEESFKTISNVKVNKNEIIIEELSNIKEERSNFENIINELNIKIADFNTYAGNRKPIAFF